VEAALYLPLRRSAFRIVFSYLSDRSKSLQRSITLLQRAPARFVGVDPYVVQTGALPRTVKAFRRVVQAYLPADQGQLLIQAANKVAEVHRECVTHKQQQQQQQQQKQQQQLEEKATARMKRTNTAAGNTTFRSSVGKEVHTNSSNDAVVANAANEDCETAAGREERTMSTATEDDEILLRIMRTPDLYLVDKAASEDKNTIINSKDASPLKGAEVTVSNSGIPNESAAPIARPRSQKVLRELFARQKTSEDLFGSSDEEGEGGKMKAASNTAVDAAGRGETTSTSSSGRSTVLGRSCSLGSRASNLPALARVDLFATPRQQKEKQEESAAIESISDDAVGKISTPTATSLPAGVVTAAAAAAHNESDTGITCMARAGQEHTSSKGEEDEEEEALEDDGGEEGEGDHIQGVEDESFIGENTADASMIVNTTVKNEDAPVQLDAISADDFLPLFTYVLIHAGLPQLLLVKELMTALVNDEDSYGECGYYLATLEAATQHIDDLARQYEAELLHKGSNQLDDNGEEIIDYL